ncbi:hypothetical protein I7I53_10408 [Histoplasma capsulatum var. duboisii H88]|uniref:Uncharacterized protein n=1 Tax=Ajellomyces capsulatus (strain H88) TaxID=544711 RepID=A0A8A1L8K1_AJEC8|nr:hypothetical protein I7I53_10408 [Histoplasma capsulatum var. duboisii H88]
MLKEPGCWLPTGLYITLRPCSSSPILLSSDYPSLGDLGDYRIETRFPTDRSQLETHQRTLCSNCSCSIAEPQV